MAEEASSMYEGKNATIKTNLSCGNIKNREENQTMRMKT